MSQYISVTAAAEEMQVSLAVIYRLINIRELRAVRVGNSLRIDKRDWVAFLDANFSGPADKRPQGS